MWRWWLLVGTHDSPLVAQTSRKQRRKTEEENEMGEQKATGSGGLLGVSIQCCGVPGCQPAVVTDCSENRRRERRNSEGDERREQGNARELGSLYISNYFVVLFPFLHGTSSS